MRYHFKCKECEKKWWTDRNGTFECKCGHPMVVTEVISTALFCNNNPTWKETIEGYLKQGVSKTRSKMVCKKM